MSTPHQQIESTNINTIVTEEMEKPVKWTLRSHYDFAILDSGYTSRIARRVLNNELDLQKYITKAIDSNKKDHVVYIKDTIWGNKENSFLLLGSQEDADWVRSVVDKDGVIVLKDVSWSDIKKAVYCLEKLDFCVYYNMGEMYDLEVYTFQGKKIICVHIDASSG